MTCLLIALANFDAPKRKRMYFFEGAQTDVRLSTIFLLCFNFENRNHFRVNFYYWQPHALKETENRVQKDSLIDTTVT